MSKTNCDDWKLTMEKLNVFIAKNGKRPSGKSSDEDEKYLGRWITNQISYYKKNEKTMKTEELRTILKKFLEDNSELFMTKEEDFLMKVDKLKEFIKKNSKRPSKRSKDENEKVLAMFLSRNIANYKNKEQIMKNSEMVSIWENLIDEFNEYLVDNIESFNINLNNLDEYIQKHDKLPSKSSSNEKEVKMANWLYNNVKIFKDKSGIFEEDEYYNLFKKMLEKHNIEFKKFKL